jgi:4-diphosphocytidyl-2-C-methyl-D-erythritol kinase
MQRRPDGYHNIQTVMLPVPWCDILEIVPAIGPETILDITGIHIDSPVENNLCYKAWRLMADRYAIPPVSIHLHKVIPAGAGLGGGSSDASFTLKMLNSMFDLNLDNEILRSLAVKLGMDCPFFIENVSALSTGRGEFLKPVSLTLDGYYLVIVKPPIHVSTAAAFLGTKSGYRENFIDEITKLPLKDWKRELHNDFEDSVFALYTEIQDIRNILYRHGAIYSSLSGSGSAIYGLFTGKPAEMDFPGCDVFQTLLGSQP